jgi:calcium-dependent protein kinase
MLDNVGEGTFGVVKRCLNKSTGAKRAVKIIKNTRFKTWQEQENFINEVKLLQQLDHPGILKLLEVYKDNQQFYFVTELYEGGELFDEIVKRKRFTERDAANIINQILLAVNYCHKRHVVHRDLKPENIVLVSNTQIKIIDFGTAEEFDPEEGIT